MFSNIAAGWVDFKFSDEFCASISYLTPVPFSVMNKLISHLKNNTPEAIFFDCEGTDFILVVNHYETYVISNRSDKPELYYNENLTAKDFIKSFYTDLVKNFNDFIMFDLDFDGTVEKYNYCKNKLIAKFSEFVSIIIEKNIISMEEYIKDLQEHILNTQFK